MGEADWWRGAVVYEVYLQSFSDSNDDGIGDLPGLLLRLDYIAALGVDAIWITPFYRSPMADSGYDVADYRAVDPRYGTLADFDAVVARAKALDLKVVIDQVWSHTADAHAWFEESRSSRDNDKADWYVWADPRPDGGPPNNWLSAFGGPAWKWEPARRQYYLHHFLPSQPKLDLTHERVLAAHFANAEFWLARGVEGFRFDAVDFMLHDDALRDNPPNPAAAAAHAWNPFRLQRHIHDMCQPTSQALMSRIRAFINRFPGAVTIGEMSSEVGALGRIANLTGNTKLHMAYTLGVMKSAFGPAMIREAISEAAVLNRTGWLCWAFNNHDVDRVATRWNPTGKEAARFARLVLALLACLPGSVCLYQGEELGLPNAQLPVEAIRDPFGLTFFPAYLGRDGARTPMPWLAATPQAGCSRAVPSWLPVPDGHRRLAVDRQEQDAESVLACYRRMLRWRKQHPALRRGELELIALPDPFVAWRRRHGRDCVTAFFNISDRPASLRAHDFASFEPALELGFVTAPVEGALHLPPYGVSLGTENRDRKRR
ncbi:MAG TPA: alpha-amylase family glycosyl hydrolase [Stellaceae bacterium]|nr:alpha-amylase family glycosyl hydrolase [Stellaceae bacterium]